ncbi:hypothetical protein TVAG_098900 [Trichomonas vaginalis G3]|uniref:Uncharacterized protein n=1 Tax=Trichomonas vaginalis (strain ATCC PRA-98 / G3) TaxID=412133 RepID=A2EME1_TRIV3|nr:hypothetical protein TVAGG3_0100090 [Trichomonas vaginalis G3]EAY06179.1 hypothetical protein TVAG_098900 [Trichomonas vaginalis G3]KAI5544328.1 hypothetical protein TVAGG3_0100090 [Trichomonas vaginalis G3]|eukprot:XP_001318402.1 hypothetical protein [Trichomonas vaginalis G3]
MFKASFGMIHMLLFHTNSMMTLLSLSTLKSTATMSNFHSVRHSLLERTSLIMVPMFFTSGQLMSSVSSQLNLTSVLNMSNFMLQRSSLLQHQQLFTTTM